MRQSNPFWRQAISENNSGFESQKGLETVNHWVNFVDPSTGVHTRSIESYWAKTKYKFKVMKGVRSDALPSYLDKRMRRDRWGTTTKDAFLHGFIFDSLGLCFYKIDMLSTTILIRSNIKLLSF
jgi:hypothetical protein